MFAHMVIMSDTDTRSPATFFYFIDMPGQRVSSYQWAQGESSRKSD